MLPPTKLSSTNDQSSDANSNFQILNISNVNAQNEIVLNDECLLRHIQLFPFLYNTKDNTFNDPDYINYAWRQITKEFNRNYKMLDHNICYTTAELQERWNVLQPIVHILSKNPKIKYFPSSLRKIIIKITTQMEEASNEAFKKPLTAAQIIILQNIPMVKKLPILQRRRLEAEIMELILNSELESNATIKIGPIEQNIIKKEYHEFMKAAGLIEINMENLNNNSLLNLNSTEDEILYSNECNEEIRVPTDLIKVNEIKSKGLKDKDNNLLQQPLPSKSRWVPLSQWSNSVRNCRM